MYRLVSLFAPVLAMSEYDILLPAPPGRGPVESGDISHSYPLRPVVAMSGYDTLFPIPSGQEPVTKTIAATHAPAIVPAGLTGTDGGSTPSCYNRVSW